MIVRKHVSCRLPFVGAGLIGLGLLAVSPCLSGGDAREPARTPATKGGSSTPLSEDTEHSDTSTLADDRGMAELESQLAQALAEVRSLRGQARTFAASPPPAGEAIGMPVNPGAVATPADVSLEAEPADVSIEAEPVTTWMRQYCNLGTSEHANGVEEFINKHFKDDVAVRRDDDGDHILVILAPEEDQDRIRSFIELLR